MISKDGRTNLSGVMRTCPIGSLAWLLVQQLLLQRYHASNVMQARYSHWVIILMLGCIIYHSRGAEQSKLSKVRGEGKHHTQKQINFLTAFRSCKTMALPSKPERGAPIEPRACCCCVLGAAMSSDQARKIWVERGGDPVGQRACSPGAAPCGRSLPSSGQASWLSASYGFRTSNPAYAPALCRPSLWETGASISLSRSPRPSKSRKGRPRASSGRGRF